MLSSMPHRSASLHNLFHADARRAIRPIVDAVAQLQTLNDRWIDDENLTKRQRASGTEDVHSPWEG